MHEPAAMSFLLEMDRALSLQDPEREQTVDDGAGRRTVGRVPRPSRTDRADRRFLRAEHDAIDFRLRRAERSRDGKRARDVRGVVVGLGARIHQDQISAPHSPIVRNIVQDARVLPARDDGIVAVSPRAPAAELRLELRLELVLHHPGSRRPHRAPVPLGRDCGRLFEGCDLVSILDESLLGDRRSRILDGGMGRRISAMLLYRDSFEDRGERAIQNLVVAEPMEEPHCSVEELLEAAERIRGGTRFLDGELPESSSGPEPWTVPNLALRVAGAYEKDRMVAPAAQAIGREERTGLFDARQVVEVAVGAEGVEDVPVSNLEPCRRQQEEAVAEAIEEPLPPLSEDLRRKHRVGAHRVLDLLNRKGNGARRSVPSPRTPRRFSRRGSEAPPSARTNRSRSDRNWDSGSCRR